MQMQFHSKLHHYPKCFLGSTILLALQDNFLVALLQKRNEYDNFHKYNHPNFRLKLLKINLKHWLHMMLLWKHTVL